MATPAQAATEIPAQVVPEIRLLRDTGVHLPVHAMNRAAHRQVLQEDIIPVVQVIGVLRVLQDGITPEPQAHHRVHREDIIPELQAHRRVHREDIIRVVQARRLVETIPEL